MNEEIKKEIQTIKKLVGDLNEKFRYEFQIPLDKLKGRLTKMEESNEAKT